MIFTSLSQHKYTDLVAKQIVFDKGQIYLSATLANSSKSSGIFSGFPLYIYESFSITSDASFNVHILKAGGSTAMIP